MSELPEFSDFASAVKLLRLSCNHNRLMAEVRGLHLRMQRGETVDHLSRALDNEAEARIGLARNIENEMRELEGTP
jgi:hypothetical protein